ncbi:MAG: methionine biosynthesis protein MetW [Patescibacteria group bacterium]
MSVKDFENNRWSNEDQKLEFRHKVALSMIDSGTVLDLGSGDGFLLSLLKEKGIEGRGLDISEEGISKAKVKGLDVSVFDFNNKLPFSDNTFDTVIMLDLLEHLYNPEFLLKEAYRVSKKNIIIGVPNFSSFPARIQMLFGKIPENNRPKKGHIFWFNYDILKSILKKAKLRVVQIKSNTFFESIPLISIITKILTKLIPNIFSLSFVVLAEKKEFI